jgi:predicted DNA-binding transcriptional regulator YafY
MNRIDRLFGILILLQSKKYVAAEKIADKFHISIRTVYRDVKALCEQGIPVSFEQNKGYFIVQGYFLPPVSFTLEEANALVLMEAIIQSLSDRSVHKHYSSALTKVKAVLKSVQKEKVEMLQNNILHQVPSFVVNDHEYLIVLQDAIASRHIIEIAYENNKQEASLRQLEPIGLIFYALSWHLIGWCHLRKDYRDFKVSRIRKITDTGNPFTIPAHIPLAEYMKELPVNY